MSSSLAAASPSEAENASPNKRSNSTANDDADCNNNNNNNNNNNSSSVVNHVTSGIHPAPNSEDGDLALARLLQQQERAMLMMYANPEDESEDDEDVDPNDDVALARRLQREEEREQRARLLALAGVAPPRAQQQQQQQEDAEGGEEEEEEEEEEDAFQSDDDVNTDGMSYEQLLAIGEANGAVSKGASAKSLVSVLTTCRLCDVPGARVDEQCSVCRDEFADTCCEVTVLPCKHYFHGECITPWLQVNRACPLCFQDVVAASTATDSDR